MGLWEEELQARRDAFEQHVVEVNARRLVRGVPADSVLHLLRNYVRMTPGRTSQGVAESH